MGKITGLEPLKEVPNKVLRMYNAVAELTNAGEELSSLKVAAITEKAGIGKGTAYEYFESKEEIVACTVCYYTQYIFTELQKELEKKESFEEQLDFLLTEMGKRDDKKLCFLRFVHMMTDRSVLCELIQQKFDAPEFREFHPLTVFSRMFAAGIERGELRGDLPMAYMVYNFYSHLICYMMMMTSPEAEGQNMEDIHMHVRQGIINELCK